MSILSLKTRHESYKKTVESNPILYTKILAVLSTGETLTSNEIAKRINKNWTRQNVQPRLLELQNKYGLVEENGKKHDYETHRNVIAYKLVER